MDQHRQPAPVDLLPDRREALVGERHAVDVRELHHAHGAELVAGALELGDRKLGVLPGQRAHEADALREAVLLRGHVVVDNPARVEALLG